MAQKPAYLQHLLLLGILLTSKGIQAQCPNKITAVSGVQQFGCTEVTVTSTGDVDNNSFCNNIGPYWIGTHFPGSYRFSFSPPITGVTLDFEAFDNREADGFGHEEVSIQINGAPYIITDAGSPNSCQPNQAIISAGGNLMSPPCLDVGGCHASCDGVQINQTISTIDISDLIFVSNIQAGVLFSIYFCCSPCLVDAGILSSPPFQLCPNVAVTVPPATNTFLLPGTMLQYVLFSDPNDTLGSIIATSNTPSFAFNPVTMQGGTTYYLAAIAGDELNGNVDLNSVCLDFSNAIEVTWWPWPAVVFSVDNTDICIGNCTIVTTSFTGEPPFSLTYTTSVTGPLTKVFQDNISSFEICAPFNAQPGNLLIQAISLTDANCSCN